MTKQQQQQQQGYNIYYHITMKGGNHPYEYFPTSQTPFQNMPSWGGGGGFYLLSPSIILLLIGPRWWDGMPCSCWNV